MKKSELLKIIQEEIENILSEGATNLTTLIPGDERQVAKKFAKMQDEERRYYGDNPYGGNWSNFSGIKFLRNKQYAAGKKGQREAADWILDNHDKWGAALAVKVGKNRWMVGGWVAT